MPRDLPLSNGSLLVAFDLEHRIRDVYFPHVGMENHAPGHLFHVGVWTEGAFAWLDALWRPARRYADHTMVTDVEATHDALGVTLRFADAVVKTIDAVVRDKTPAELLRRTRNYWQFWATHEQRDFADLSAEAVRRYYQSLIILHSQIDGGGAVLAANDSDIVRFNRDTYSYAWPRDGALAGVALARAGQFVPAERFLEFCAHVISPEGYVRHKYNPDGTLASSWHPWLHDGKPVLPIQEDETALVIWALGEYFDRSRRVETVAPFYRPLVTRPADFLLGYVDASGLPLPSHDLWEERWGVHFYTVAAVIAGLRAAARLAQAFGETERAERYGAGAERMFGAMRAALWSEGEGRFVRMTTNGPHGWEHDTTMDASLLGPVELDVLPPDDPQVEATARQVEARLWVQTGIGGLARYENDSYQQVEKQDTRRVPGNPWFVATLWLARYHLKRAREAADLKRGLELVEWAARHALPSGVMAEQLHPATGEPLSVSPLTWSHAAYIAAVEEYLARAHQLTACPTCGHAPASAASATAPGGR